MEKDEDGFYEMEVRLEGISPEPLLNRNDVMSDEAVKRFKTYLYAERNASEHTVSGYVQDIGQFAAFVWPDAR